LPPTRSFDGVVHAVGASSAEPGRSPQTQGTSAKLRQETPERQGKKVQSKRRKRAPRYRYSVRTDFEPIALRAFWGMHVEAMNFSGMGHAEYAAALGLSPHALHVWRDRLEESGEEMDWRSLLHPSARAQLSSAANCARRKYRLTEHAVEGRSNRRRSATSKSGRWCRRRRSLGSAWRRSAAAMASHRHQPALPLAGPVRSDRSKGAPTGNGGVRRRRDE
jgi:hypothetical protein